MYDPSHSVTWVVKMIDVGIRSSFIPFYTRLDARDEFTFHTNVKKYTLAWLHHIHSHFTHDRPIHSIKLMWNASTTILVANIWKAKVNLVRHTRAHRANSHRCLHIHSSVCECAQYRPRQKIRINAKLLNTNSSLSEIAYSLDSNWNFSSVIQTTRCAVCMRKNVKNDMRGTRATRPETREPKRHRRTFIRLFELRSNGANNARIRRPLKILWNLVK